MYSRSDKSSCGSLFCEYWTLDRIAGTSNVTVNLSWNTQSCGVTNLSDLRIVNWNGTQWKDKGNGGTTGTVAAGTIITTTSVSVFGPFSLASMTKENPLPIDLIHFNGECENNNTILNWETGSELNNNFFCGGKQSLWN